MTDLERKIYGAVRDADDAFEKSGETGTKTWIRDFLLPTLAEHGLEIRPTKPELTHFDSSEVDRDEWERGST